MSDGHRTSSIQRPRAATRAAVRPDSDGTRFSDFTRPIAQDKQLVKGSGYRLLIGVVAVVVVAALMAALFVLPVKSWYRQRDDLAERKRQLAVLDAANFQLTAEVSYLRTPDGIKEAAREEVGYGEPGEKRFTVLPSPQAPISLPAGWPYDGVTQIIAVRVAEAAAAAAPSTTVATEAPEAPAAPVSAVAAASPPVSNAASTESAAAASPPAAAAASTEYTAAASAPAGDAAAGSTESTLAAAATTVP